MDNKRRERLKTASCLIDRAYTIIESVLDREQECVDNYPESFQDTDKYEKMEAAVEALEEAVDSLDDVRDQIQIAIA